MSSKEQKFFRLAIGLLVVAIFVAAVGAIRISYFSHVRKINADIEPAVEEYHQVLLSDRNNGLFPGGDLNQPFHETDEGQKLVDYLYQRASRFWGDRRRVFSNQLLITPEYDQNLYNLFYRPGGSFDGWGGLSTMAINRECLVESILDRKAVPPNHKTAEMIMEYYYVHAYLTEAMERKEALQITCYGEYRERLQKDIYNFEILNDRFQEQEKRAMETRTIFIPWLLNR